jgi:hypothetical protein
LSEQHHAAVKDDPSAIEGGADLLAGRSWKVEGQSDIGAE